VRLEVVGKLKKSTLSGLDPATFRLVPQCFNQLRYRVPSEIVFCINFADCEKIAESAQSVACTRHDAQPVAYFSVYIALHIAVTAYRCHAGRNATV
jgi:hypothetical protein